MKAFSAIQIVVTSLLAALALLGPGQGWAGNLTVNGDLTVSSNLSAQSITLGGVTNASWPTASTGLPLQGYKYVIVGEGTNDTHRGNNLRAAYATATTLSPSSGNRVAVIVPPGNYSGDLVMNTNYVDLIGLVPAQMTTKQVFTDSAGRIRTKTVAKVRCPVSISGTITQTVGDVRIESVILQGYYPTVSDTNTVLRHASITSMRTDIPYAGQYVDCVGGGGSFGCNYTASGTFVDCVAGASSFGYYASASGTFTRCTGNEAAFGCGCAASGVFVDCVGGYDSFAGQGGTGSGTFIHCVGGDGAFGSDQGDVGYASGSFIDCVGGDYCFGSGGSASGTFIDCVARGYSFGGGGGSLATSAKLQHCKGGTTSFGSFAMASQDFNYNVGGTNTFLMLPNLPTNSVSLPSGSVWNSNGVLRVAQ